MNSNKKKPLVSVIMPVYNGKDWFVDTINSILQQTYTNFEYIIVDDCSTDGSYEELLEIAKQDTRIKLFRTPKNCGNPGGSGKFAVEHVSSDSKYILPIDQDDIAVLDRLKKSVAFMEKNPDIDICGGWQKMFGTKNRLSKSVKKNDEIKARLITGCQFGHSTTILRKSFLDKNNLNYKDELCQDYILWVEACLDHGAKVHNLQEVLLHYRVHDEQTSHNNTKLENASDNVRAYQLKKLGFTNKEEIDFHNAWKRKKLAKNNENLIRLENHIKKIINANIEYKVYPHNALVRRLNYLYRKDLFKHKKYLRAIFYNSFK